MDWKRYALSFLGFNGLGAPSLYVLLRWQGALPFNPEHFAGMSPIMAFNTAASFVTTTNLQDYGGESTLSYLSKAAGLAQQNFLAAASGVVTLLAVARAFMRSEGRGLGNFWVDTTRTVLYLFLPLAAIFTVFYIQQGAIENWVAYVHADLIQPFWHDGHWIRHQVLAMGPAASQEAITILAGDGGAVFNAGVAHPFVNPTPLSNLGQMVSFLLIPTALIFWFGRALRRPRVAWAILACTTLLWLPLAVTSEAADLVSNPQFPPSVSRASGPDAGGGGNLEGVDLRFGSGACALFGSLAATTGAGMSGCAYDSMMPLSSGINMVFMQLGELLFGGARVGLESFLATMIFAVFLAGLMTGRSPVFLAKKIEAFEIKMVALSLLVMPVLVLLTTAFAVSVPDGRAAVFNPGPQGFSEVLYEFTSAVNNNGSDMGGLNVNTTFYNALSAMAMLFGRYFGILPLLAMAGSLIQKKRLPQGAGILRESSVLMILFVTFVIVVLGAITFLPAFALGPLAAQWAILPPPQLQW
ncbi:potassium-transporting ATPase subunit KdpA [Acidithiobacillus caldus]|uniref:Potassium-transporting ATPase A chain n=4 Tax=Acidithiobacillus caldus TaxID=33059 RepID=F9ZPP8_ACICS|nr:potassium-transporting ATPase subunit KdpA [Acidithiobacillus caldus]AEK56797.1 Potassium-transporting ATPase A chain [Acidithiobacillus caldus SM-1]AIA54105.1 Potassium-transporting ATPase A chain [Acidithiobacillus caldus ATCC 51756]MBU2730214.1 potassium-transporting ATPase subunit A [Acidithiobacillus caldus]MBU2734720.1 potassium-transporting ATPase subunit A [Acidithiobacillus caldus ATCC 51756]MBU2743841.1 potassium-transporting ATPase subunit A [Acidithiobacillus caldus]